MRVLSLLRDEGDAKVKKSIFATVLAVMLAFVFATPAFAGTMNSNEKVVYDKFCAAVDSKIPTLVHQERANSFKSWAEKALTDDSIDLTEDDCNKFSAKIDEVLAYIESNGITDNKAAWDAYPTIAKMINELSEQYGITVIVNVADRMGELQVNGKTVGTTASGAKQTGFGLAQTAIVAGAATATLAGAFVVARKNRLFA